MKALLALLTAVVTCVLLVACHDFTVFNGTSLTPDASCPEGTQVCADTPNVCSSLSSAQHCGSCDLRCGAACTSQGCEGPVELALGKWLSCARFADGTVSCFGGNIFNEISSDLTIPSTPTPAFNTTVTDSVQLCAGNDYACSRSAAGVVSCWGRNLEGELGTGEDAGQRYEALPLTGAEGAIDLACGQGDACIRQDGGAVLCWGADSNGMLGDGVYGNSYVPVLAKLVPRDGGVRQLALGREHSCALLWNGQILCWGQNTAGQLGNGSFTTSLNPVLVQGITNAVELASGQDFSCAVLNGGAIECWGGNAYGQLGTGDAGGAYNTPQVVGGVLKATHIVAGYSTACSLRDTDETISCWGANDAGQVGNGSTAAAVPWPQQIGGQNVTQIALGAWHACYFGVPQRISCFGDNDHQQTGAALTVPFSLHPNVVQFP